MSNQLIVGFKRGVSRSDQQSLLSNAGGQFKRRFSGIRGGSIRPRSRLALGSLRKRLQASAAQHGPSGNRPRHSSTVGG